MKYIRYVRERFSKPDFPAFSISDLKLFLKSKHISNDYLHLMVHNLMYNKELKRITGGIYTFHNDAIVVGFAFKPFYYGLENALSMRGLSDQGANYTVMTSRNVRAGIRNFQGRNYRIQKIKKEFMFGYGLINYGNFWVPVSDVEKTVIDMIYFDDHIRKELWPSILSSLNLKGLKEYLKAYKPAFRDKVMENIEGMRKKGTN
jgi:hypothetical protein